MRKYKTKITLDEYLKALALFTIAHDHYAKACEFAQALNRIIMAVPEKYPGGHVDDAIYTDDRTTVENFDDALRLDGVEIDDSAANAA